MKKIAKIWRNKSVGPDGAPGEILKLGGVAMTPYLARLLEITRNNATIPKDLKRAKWFLFTKRAINRQPKIVDP